MDSNNQSFTFSECFGNFDKKKVDVIKIVLTEILGKDLYCDLKKYYFGILNGNYGKKDFIVFDDRTSIKLSKLFLLIIWFESDIKIKQNLETNFSKFTTLNSFLELSKNDYDKAYFVFDVLYNGRHFNEVMNRAEDTLEYTPVLSPGESYYSMFERKFQIRVYSQNENISSANVMYQFKIKPFLKITRENGEESYNKYIEINKIVYKINYAISLLECFNDHNNPSISGSINFFETNLANKELTIDGEKISYKSFDEGGLLEKRFYGFKGNNFLCLYYFAICHFTKEYKLTPHIVLPVLSQEKYNLLKDRVFSKWGLKYQFTSLKYEFSLITLYLNYSFMAFLIREFNLDSNALQNDLYQNIINFGINCNNSPITKEEFTRLINPDYLFDIDELIDTLNEISSEAFTSLNGYGKEIDFSQDPIPDAIYKLKKFEQSGEYLIKYNIPPEKSPFVKMIQKNCYNWNIPIRYFLRENSSYDLMSNIFDLFSLITNGYVSLDMMPINYTMHASFSNYFHQTIRANEYALFIFPQKCLEYSSFISYLLRYCNQIDTVYNDKKRNSLKFSTLESIPIYERLYNNSPYYLHIECVLTEFLKVLKNQFDINDDEIQKMKANLMIFIESMRSMGSDTSCWLDNLLLTTNTLAFYNLIPTEVSRKTRNEKLNAICKRKTYYNTIHEKFPL